MADAKAPQDQDIEWLTPDEPQSKAAAAPKGTPPVPGAPLGGPIGVPAGQMQESLLGKGYALSAGLGRAVPQLLPPVAATVAGALAPEAAPITAPLAYAATEGLINPKEVQQHPIREGIAAGTMALPGPAEAAGYAFPRFAVEHPALMRAGGAALGGLVGSSVGEKSGGGRYGELGGGLGGAFLGYRLGGAESTEMGKRLVEDVMEGKRPFSELPARLARPYLSQETALGKLAAIRALQRGETPEMINLPSGVRETAQKMYEERVKMQPELPRTVLTPEEFSNLEGETQYLERQKAMMKPSASTRGMAHAAGQHEPGWVPSKRAETTTISKSSRLLPIVRPRAEE